MNHRTIRSTGNSMGTSILAILILLFAGGAVLAQPPGLGGGPGSDDAALRGGPGGRHGERGLERLFEFLDLDEGQQAAWKVVLEESKSSIEPVFEQMKDNRKALHDAVEAGTDATLIGELTLAGKALREQLKAHHEGVEAELLAILDSEQREKYEAFQAARPEHGRRGPRGHRGPGEHGGRARSGGKGD